MITERTTAQEVIQLLLNCYDSDDKPSSYSLYEVSGLSDERQQRRWYDYGVTGYQVSKVVIILRKRILLTCCLLLNSTTVWNRSLTLPKIKSYY